MQRHRHLTAKFRVFVAAISAVVVAVAEVVEIDTATAVWTSVTTTRTWCICYISSRIESNHFNSGNLGQQKQQIDRETENFKQDSLDRVKMHMQKAIINEFTCKHLVIMLQHHYIHAFCNTVSKHLVIMLQHHYIHAFCNTVSKLRKQKANKMRTFNCLKRF